MFAQTKKSTGNPHTADVFPSRQRPTTKRTIATPSIEITALLTPATLSSTNPVITIVTASHGAGTRADLGIERAASTTAATAVRPITSDSRPAPPAPTSPAS